MHTSVLSFEKFYDTYSPMLYGIALQLSPSQQKAEDLLIKTFEIIHEKKIAEQDETCSCIQLIKLIIQTAQGFKYIGPAPFYNAPLVNQILSQKISVREICLQKRLTIIQLGKVIREELNSLRIPVRRMSYPLQEQHPVNN
ncbi:MAG: hypothetical protein ABUT20_54710 [Bacteroidota bacterium]